MNKRFSLFALLCCYQLNAQEPVTIDSSYANNAYKHRLAFFRQMPDEKGEIIFLGNSLTEAGEWQELTRNPKVKNRGISGDVTYGLIARLDEVLSSKPAKIFILTGTNDLKRGIPVDTITRQFDRMLSIIAAQSPNTKIYLQSVFPVNETMISKDYRRINNMLVQQLNELLKKLSLKHQIIYVDVQSILKDEQGNLKKEYTHDGIHLWPDAYIHWARFLQTKKYL
jgi:lysophospholipase L1-like esterase